MSGHKYSNEENQFLIDNVKGITLKELTNKFNKKFNLNVSEEAIQGRKKKLNIRSGIMGGQFQKGHKPFNKGLKWDQYMSKEGQEKSRKTTYKKGNIPKNKRYIGSERITKDGYIEIKVENPNRWELKHRYIYKKIYGEIPEGYKIFFADGNRQNVDISNLILVSDSEELIMNRRKLYSENPEITESGSLIAKVIDKTNKLKKGINKE